jgi:hypothetical protein
MIWKFFTRKNSWEGLHASLPNREHFTFSVIGTPCKQNQTAPDVEYLSLDQAAKARGNYLLFVSDGCKLRPDLLYRYEQTLQRVKDPENTVLSLHPLHFPFVFSTKFFSGLLIPKKHFYPFDDPFDLLDHLERKGLRFLHLPFPLITGSDPDCSEKSLRRYLQRKKLNWHVQEGLKKKHLSRAASCFGEESARDYSL